MEVEVAHQDDGASHGLERFDDLAHLSLAHADAAGAGLKVGDGDGQPTHPGHEDALAREPVGAAGVLEDVHDGRRRGREASAEGEARVPGERLQQVGDAQGAGEGPPRFLDADEIVGPAGEVTGDACEPPGAGARERERQAPDVEGHDVETPGKLHGDTHSHP